jgi:transposase InsO family protein
VHTDLVGPTGTKFLKREQYFMLLVDDYTRMTVVCFHRKNSKARYDNGGEFTSKEFMDFCNKHGIKRKLSSFLRHLNKMELSKGGTG